MYTNPIIVELLYMLYKLGVVENEIQWFYPDITTEVWRGVVEEYNNKFEVDPHFSDIKVEMIVDEREYRDPIEVDRDELRELILLDLHLQPRQQDPTPMLFGPRCRCQSPSSFAIDSS